MTPSSSLSVWEWPAPAGLPAMDRASRLASRFSPALECIGRRGKCRWCVSTAAHSRARSSAYRSRAGVVRIGSVFNRTELDDGERDSSTSGSDTTNWPSADLDLLQDRCRRLPARLHARRWNGARLARGRGRGLDLGAGRIAGASAAYGGTSAQQLGGTRLACGWSSCRVDRRELVKMLR